MRKDTMPEVARYWNAIAGDFDAIYTGRGKSRFSRFLDQTLRKDIYGRFEWVMERSGNVAGKTICDVGCGSGRFVSAFARKGASVTGIDIAPEMIRMARALASREGVAGQCEFHVSDILNWKADRTFDETIAIGFWDYIADPPERLRRIRAMTGEKFLSAWPRLWTWRMPVRKVRLSLGGCPVYFFRRRRVVRMLEEAGFEVLRVDVVGKLFCVESRPR
ncbi:MAG TPA: class I SAM-dependent methyltransferase [Bryobacteraceae bacterium]|jgi:SAM-dependent methyltransferase|nr:class I SAM-dependent methyltransferase [Bryobacteraceae bacterium]